MILDRKKSNEIKRVTFEELDHLDEPESKVRAVYKDETDSQVLEARVNKTEDDVQEIKKSLGQIVLLLKNQDNRRSRSQARSPERRTPEKGTVSITHVGSLDILLPAVLVEVMA